MSARPTLFIDRDGTLIEEPADEQVDSLEKVRFLPGVFAALTSLRLAGYQLVIVSNQDGLGSPAFPQEDFEGPQRWMLQAFASQGIEFDGILICPHRPEQQCPCRKPGTALVEAWIAEHPIDAERSCVIGDRETDLQLGRRLGLRALQVTGAARGGSGWSGIVGLLTAAARRRAQLDRATQETRIRVEVELGADRPNEVHTGIAFFDHMLEQVARHGRLSLVLHCAGDLEVDEHHTVEDCALALGQALRAALGDKLGLGRYGFVLPMDESQAQVVVDLSGRAYAVFEGNFARESVGGLPTELVPHFFRSLADAMGAAIHIQVTGDNAHHMIEACFKGLGRALRDATRIEGQVIPSSKGVL